jgi:hypothetical protein
MSPLFARIRRVHINVRVVRALPAPALLVIVSILMNVRQITAVARPVRPLPVTIRRHQSLTVGLPDLHVIRVRLDMKAMAKPVP